jgi:vancomycin resistance protein YoaR
VTPVPPHQADEAPTVAFRATPVPPQPEPGTRQSAGPALPPPGPTAGSPTAGSPTAGSATTTDPKRRTMLMIAAGAVTVVLAVGIGTYAYAAAGDIPRGTTVLGLDIGGQSEPEATAALQAHLAARASAPAKVTLDGKAVELAPKDVGLAVDIPATAAAAADSGTRVFGTKDVTPVTRVDAKKLDAALRRQLDPKSVTVKKPAITYAGLVPKPTYPAPGRDLDPARTSDLVRTAWLSGAPVDIPLVERPPATTAAQVDEMVATLATPAVAAPVTVTTPRGTFTLTPKAIAKGLVFVTNNAGLLSPKIDAKRLRAAATKELAKVEVAPEEATISLKGGKPKVVASTSGQVVDLAKIGPALLAVLPNPDARTVEATIVQKDADTTDADMAKLGIKEKVSTFTTKFPGGLSSPRSQNIVTIAKEVDGAVVKPGETFSLNGHTGERSYPQGYKDAPVIVGGKLEPGVGGGASQFTTTLFNAAYYAGLQDVEHKPHSFWFSRYPAVIESTIFYPDLDLKFKNTTPYGILIDTSHTGKTVTVSMWSTKVYDSVKTKYGPRRNFTSPPTVYRDPGPKCIATSGLPGFTQDAFRVIRKDGKEVKREKFSWRYDPEPRFICAKEPS